MKNKKRGVTVGSCLSFMFSDTPKNQFREIGKSGNLHKKKHAILTDSVLTSYFLIFMNNSSLVLQAKLEFDNVIH